MTGQMVRKNVESMHKIATSDQIVSLGNPARMLVNSEADLALILKLTDDKSQSDDHDLKEQDDSKIGTT